MPHKYVYVYVYIYIHTHTHTYAHSLGRFQIKYRYLLRNLNIFDVCARNIRSNEWTNEAEKTHNTHTHIQNRNALPFKCTYT